MFIDYVAFLGQCNISMQELPVILGWRGKRSGERLIVMVIRWLKKEIRDKQWSGERQEGHHP